MLNRIKSLFVEISPKHRPFADFCKEEMAKKFLEKMTDLNFFVEAYKLNFEKLLENFLCGSSKFDYFMSNDTELLCWQIAREAFKESRLK